MGETMMAEAATDSWGEVPILGAAVVMRDGHRRYDMRDIERGLEDADADRSDAAPLGESSTGTDAVVDRSGASRGGLPAEGDSLDASPPGYDV